MPYSKSLKNQIQIMPEELTDNVLLFLSGKIPCAIPLLEIATVIRMIEITPVNMCQGRLEGLFSEQKGLTGIAGCITYRGELIPVYYLNAFFGENIGKPALTDKLIILNAGKDGTGMLSALWVKSITGVYGRNDLFRIKEPGVQRENSDKEEAAERFTTESVNDLEAGTENNPGCLNASNKCLKIDNENKEYFEENEGYIDSGIFGLKIYSSDLDSLILVIENISEFILLGRSGRLNDSLDLHINKYLKKRQLLNELTVSVPQPEIHADTNTDGSRVDKSKEITKKFAESLEEKASKDIFVTPEAIPEAEIKFFEEESVDSEEFKKIKTILLERKKQIEQPYEEARAGEMIEILRFRLMYREYAFVMKYIREVLIYDKLTPVPGTPDYIPGIFALRGEIISLVDLRKFFSLHCRGLTDLNLVIILTNGEITFGILADYITDIGTIPLHKLKAPEDISIGISSKYIKGILDNSLIVLDAEALLLDPDMIIDEK